MRRSDADYFAKRLNAEWHAIKAAECGRARDAHAALADLYADKLIRSLEPAAKSELRLVV